MTGRLIIVKQFFIGTEFGRSDGFYKFAMNFDRALSSAITALRSIMGFIGLGAMGRAPDA